MDSIGVQGLASGRNFYESDRIWGLGAVWGGKRAVFQAFFCVLSSYRSGWPMVIRSPKSYPKSGYVQVTVPQGNYKEF